MGIYNYKISSEYAFKKVQSIKIYEKENDSHAYIELKNVYLLVPKNDTNIDLIKNNVDYEAFRLKTIMSKNDCIPTLTIEAKKLDLRKIRIYGYILENSSELHLFSNLGNYELSTSGNAIITYPSYESAKGNNDKINKCTYGICYTDEFSQNRLIITGNENEINCDYWTDNINVYGTRDTNKNYNDFTYFPEENGCYYGNSDNKINGYAVEASGKLVVFKEYKADDSSIYFREGDRIYIGQDNVANQYYYAYKLKMSAGNTGVSPINNRCILNFNGTILFLSNEKKVEALVVSDSLHDSSRYSVTKSYYINYLLDTFDHDYLEERAFMYAYNKWLYLVCGTQIFARRYDEETNDNYEWYVLNSRIFKENEYITSMFVRNESVYFATNFGSIFRVGNREQERNIYEDTYKILVSNNEITENVVNIEKQKLIHKGDRLYSNYEFYLPDLRLYLGENFKGRAICMKEQVAFEICKIINDSGANVYLFLNSSKKYRVIGASYLGNNIVELDTENNDIADNLDDYKLVFEQKNEILTLKEIFDNGGFILNWDYGDGQVDAKLINIGVPNHSGYFEHVENVRAAYITAPFHMGYLDTYKNFYSYTVTNDSKLSSKVRLATITNSMPMSAIHSIGNVIQSFGNVENDTFVYDLDKIDFDALSYTQDYIAARSYTKYRNIVKQRFICFAFYNYDNSNAVISNMTIDYAYTTPVVGGD